MDNREGSVKPADNDSIGRYCRRSSRHLIARLAGRLRSALHILYPLTAITLVALAVGCGPGATPVWPSMTVNNSGDETDFSPGDGKCQITANSSVCTLRAAIQETNAHPGAQKIFFNLPDGGHVILPNSPLPTITENTTLDGTTQPGYDGNTPTVIVDGVNMDGSGLFVAHGHELLLRALEVRNFSMYGIVSNGMFYMDRSVISGNHASGIILADESFPIITNSIIRNNGTEDPSIKVGGLLVENGTVTITNSSFTDNLGWNSGAIYIMKGEVRLNGSTLTKNIGWDAGGVYVADGEENLLWIKDGTRIGKPGEGNIAGVISEGTKLGGGIYSEANVKISDSSIEGNSGAGIQIFHQSGLISLDILGSVLAGNSLQGIDAYNTNVSLSDSDIRENDLGGISMHLGTLSVIRTGVTGNENAGGILMEGGHLEMTDATVADNTNGGPGGGVYGHNLAVANIVRSTISGNSTTAQGGGLYLQSYGQVQIINSTISSNQADTGGGGFSAGGGTFQLTHVTLADNESGTSGAIQNSANLTITNSILAENNASNCDASAPPTSGGHNLSDDGSCVFSGAGDISNQNARLGPLLDNGGATLTHALMNDSPAIDTADDSFCPPTDQRGITRPMGAHCDMGSFELENPEVKIIPTLATETPKQPAVTQTPTLISILFDPVNFSSEVMYSRYGRSCSPKQLTIQVKVSPPELVYSLGLFYRLEEKEGTNVTQWGGGFSMIPQGGGWYQLTIYSEDFPDTSKWGHDAWLEIQFVANGKDGKPIARSAVYRSVSVARCMQ